MKRYVFFTAVSVAFIRLGYSQPGNAPFANQYLSNLHTPTAVNIHLLPWKSNEINLGSASKNWKNFYLEGSVYKGSDRFLSSDNSGNTFLGISAGKANTGSGNTAFGDNAMFNNTSGSYSTAFGYHALASMNETVFNTAFGYLALSSSTGSFNSGFGTGALANTTTGEFNAASGNAALFNNSEGGSNTAVGIFALVQNTTGVGNTGIGQFALGGNLTNSFNTGIGNDAGGNSSDYSNTTFLGAFTNADPGVTNATAIGFNALAKKSNQVVVGNAEVTSIGGFANWSNFSDGRYKKNIKADVPGIEFIKQLKPVTYTLDVDGIENTREEINSAKLKSINIRGLNGEIPFSANALMKAKKMQSPEELKAKQEKARVVYTGFIAQEVEQAAKKLNYDFSGIDAPKSQDGFYALRYGDFVVPLVKAVQEQQKQIDELKALLLSLTKQENSPSNNFSSAFLKQNAPNPFSKSTVVRYYIPDNAGHAQVVITDMKGALIKSFFVAKGEGQISIESREWPASTYNYSLVIDGRKVDSRQMVLIR